MVKKKHTPTLRFPDFKDEWDRKQLSEIGEFKNGINKSKEDFGFGVPFINLMDVFGKSVISDLKLDLVNANEKEINLYELKKGDVLFIRSSVKREGVGETSLILKDLENTVYSGFLIRFRDDKITLDLDFKKYCFSINKFREDLISLSTTSANTNINQESLNELEISFPTLPEQQKISSFLTSVDERIQQLTRKKNLLEQYKKGVMQKIFSREIRFKDDKGKDFPDWDEKTLGDIAEKKIQKNKDNKINNVFTNSAAQGIVNQRDFFDKDIANQNNLLNYYIVDRDDFVYNPRISNLAPVGPISRNHLDTGIMSPLYSVFRITQGNLNFFELYFSTTKWHGYMESIANYGARSDRMNITTGDFYNLPLPFPVLPEQNKIASFLSSIDKKNELFNSQLEKTQAWKKGLLQKMFV